MRFVFSLLMAFSLAGVFTQPVQASFHLMNITEIMAQSGGDPRMQFIELQMTSSFQNAVIAHKILFFDAKGTKTGEFSLPGNVTNGQAQGGELPFILIGTQAFKDKSKVAPDFILPEGLMHPYAGKVVWDVSAVDSIAYGDYTGSNNGFGGPAPGFPVNGALSLTRIAAGFPKNNAADFAFRTPSPRNNAFAQGNFDAPLPCYLNDTFANMDNWDQPARNAGLDITDCGAPVVADIGFAEAVGGKLILTPGLSDQLGLGNPIAFTTLSNAAARSAIDQNGSENYRVQFNMLAHSGITDAAFFVRQHIDFDAGAKVLNPIQSAGLGFNMGFDNIGETTDHIHADVRLACISEGDIDGEDQADFPPGFITQTESSYTVVMDIDGDDVNGPLTLQVKLFPSDQPEPRDYLATYFMGQGLGANPAEELDHVVLLAALGASNLEITNFSICAIPRNQQHIRSLFCERQQDGSIQVAWQNPAQAENKPIDVFVNGTKLESLSGDAIDTLITDPPAGDVTISIANYSTISVSCTVCQNDPPVINLAGPARAELVPDLKVTIDSTGSTDPDGGELTRIWEIVGTPDGSNASIDDFTAAIIHVSLDLEGVYNVKLTLSDSGCNGDNVPLAVSQAHTITVFKPGTGSKFIRGDSNCSGEADISDAVHMLTYSFLGGEAPCCPEAANSNGDGNIADTTDAVVLLGRLFLGDPPLPAPYPLCGDDPGGATCEGHLFCNPQ